MCRMAMRTADGSTSPIEGSSCLARPAKSRASGIDGLSLVSNLQAANAIPIRDVLAFPPQQITGPLAIDGADASFTGIDFVPDAFVRDPVRPGAVLYSFE